MSERALLLGKRALRFPEPLAACVALVRSRGRRRDGGHHRRRRRGYDNASAAPLNSRHVVPFLRRGREDCAHVGLSPSDIRHIFSCVNVTTLRERDLDGALSLVAEASVYDGSVPFSLEVIEQLRGLVPADRAGYFEYHAGGTAHGETTSILVETPGEAAPIEWDEAVLAIGDTWPLADTPHKHSATALLLSDFLTVRARRRNPWYAQVLQPRNIEHECKLWLGGSPWAARGFFLVRSRGSADFDERDRTILNLLRPHLKNVRERWLSRRFPPLLTARECEVLELARVGLTNKEIARHLVIAPTTVRAHFEHIFAKLGVHTRTAAIHHAHQGSGSRAR